MRDEWQLWSWQGVVSRRAYFVTLIVLVLEKWLVDYFVSWHIFVARWTPLIYMAPPGVGSIHYYDTKQWLLLMAAGAPLLAASMALSARRLRDIGASPRWAALLLVPVVNIAFFVTLCAKAARQPILACLETNPYRAQAELTPATMSVRAIAKGTIVATLLGLLTLAGIILIEHGIAWIYVVTHGIEIRPF